MFVLYFFLSIVLASLISTWIVLKFAATIGLVDQPSGRSSHEHETPHGGGAGMVLVGTFAGIWIALDDYLLVIVLCLALFLALVGFIDDIRPVSVKLRFGAQAFAIGALLWQLGPLPAVGPIQGSLLVGLVMLAGLWWVNLFNFMDGIDGISSVQAISMLGCAAGLALYLNPGILNSPIITIMSTSLMVITGFLIFNLPPAKIFMGDVGSLWLGFMIFALAILTIQLGWLKHEVWLILGAVFISDSTVTLLRRLIGGECLYEAHRSHAYQRLSRLVFDGLTSIEETCQRRTKSHRFVTFGVLLINLLWLTPLAFISLVWPTWSWWAVFVAYLPVIATVIHYGAGRPDHA